MRANAANRCALVLCLALAAGSAAPALSAPQEPQPPLPGAASSLPREGTCLYRFHLVQAAPGRLLDLIDLLKLHAAAIAAGGDEAPFIVRHSQGDHWDVAVVHPLNSRQEYDAPERVAKRLAAAEAAGLSEAELARRLDETVAWQEDLFVLGPPVESFRTHVAEAGLLHFEMMRSLPGKRAALVEERRMENAFARGRGRGDTLIFVRVSGAAWDVVTLAAYRNWRQFGESETIPADVADAAARKAGFASAAGVGPYMRTLISTHRDTLGPPVRWER